MRHPDQTFVASCVLAIGKIASALPVATGSCLFGLMALMAHPATPSNVVADSVVVMRRIMQQNKDQDVEEEKKWMSELEEWEVAKTLRAVERAARRETEGADGEGAGEEEIVDSPSSSESEEEEESDIEENGGVEMSEKKKKKRAKKKAKKEAKKIKKKAKKAKKKLKKAKKSASKSRRASVEEEEAKFPRPVRNDPVVRVIHKLWTTTVPTARASIVWMISEFQFKEEIRQFAPDALRRLAKSFKDEEVEVKLQILNLAVKMALAKKEVKKVVKEKIKEEIKEEVKEEVKEEAKEEAKDDEKVKEAKNEESQAAAEQEKKTALIHATVQKLMDYILELARYDNNTVRTLFL